jgi:hypothetical protein
MKENAMNIALARSLFFYSTVMNFGLLGLWAILMLMPHGWMRMLWIRQVSAERFDEISFGGMIGYKILILMFNLVPLLALLIAG